MKDLYRILRVSPSATLEEIKTSYRKLVWELHPDSSDKDNTAEFRKVTEAYQILSSPAQRREYDQTNGHFGGKFSGRRTRVVDQRLYRPYAPPDFKTWDHKRHYEMHYGDGMQREAIKQATREAKLEGSFQYRSPLGKGFTFDSSDQKNPYSKYHPQGPPKVTFEYEEGYKANGETTVHRRERIIHDMYGRRTARQEEELRREMQKRRRTNAAFESSKDECVIL